MATKSVAGGKPGKVQRVVVVGGGVAGLTAVLELCEAGIPVYVFSLGPVKRSPSVGEQDGIGASLDTKGEGDSPRVHLEESVYGGDFLANQPPVKGMTDAASGIVLRLDRMGVPFNRTPEGRLDLRASGGTLFHRTAFAGATTGQQVLYALDRQVRRYEGEPVLDGRGLTIPGEKLVRKFESWDFLSLVLDDSGRVRGIVAQDLVTMAIEAFAADAVCLATGGVAGVYGRGASQVRSTGSATSIAYQQGAAYANGEFIQLCPTAIPGKDKLRLISESVRGEGGRVWVPKDPTEARRGRDVPERDRDYFLEDRYPTYGNLVPGDVASRAVFKKCVHEGRGIRCKKTGRNEYEVYLDVTHLSHDRLRKKLSGVLDLYEKFAGEDPYENPMRVTPAVGASIGGLWVDFERAPDGGLVAGSPRNQATNLPGLYAAGEADYQYHGANGLGGSSLLSCLYGGTIAGQAIASYLQSQQIAAVELPGALFERAAKDARTKYEKILLMDGDENPYGLHEELSKAMLLHVTVERHNARLGDVLGTVDELERRARKASALDTAGYANPSAPFVRHLGNMLVLARVIVQGARSRDESRGAHYKPERPARDDELFLRTTLALHQDGGEGKHSVKLVRELDYDCAGQRVHATDRVDVSLVEPRPRDTSPHGERKPASA